MRPPPTAGEAESAEPASNSHSFFPEASSSTYSRPSFDPIYMRSPRMAGDESMRAFVANVQIFLPVFAFKQCTSLSRPPSTTFSPSTAAD